MSKARELSKLLSGTLKVGALQAPAGTTAQRPNGQVGQIRYNSETGKNETYDSGGWGAIATPPLITTVSPSTYNGEAGTQFTINGSFFDTGISVKFIDNANNEYTAATVTRVSNSQLLATTPQDFTVAQEPLKVKVINPSGLSYTIENAIDCGGVPAWTTPAGSLGTCYDSMREGFYVDVVATDPDANATISYAVTAGSLPTNMSLNSSTGRISGTPNAVVSDVTSNFTITATDNAGSTTQRAFSITIKAPVAQTFSYTGSEQVFNIPAGLSKIKAKLWGAAGGTYYDGTVNNGQGGAGGYTETTFNVLSGETQLTLVVGSGSEYYNAPYGGAGSGTNGGCAGGGMSAILSGSLSGLFTEVNSASVPTSTLTNLAGATQIIAVAGGGGGGGWYIYNNILAGCGGGLTGGQASGGYWQPTGGSQTEGGTYFGVSTPSGKFRGSDVTASGNGGSGGGGAGWYGGGSGYSSENTNSSGGGGSGFIGYADGSTSTVLTANGSFGSYTDTVTRTNGTRTYTNSKCLREAERGINPPNTSDPHYADDVGKAGAIGTAKLNGGDGRIVLIY